MGNEQPYRMTLSLNVLNHLGINLYSNVPAVISEAVANAWDADASTVDIKIDAEEGSIVITDNGSGMTHAEVNDHFLHVGYRRRAEPGGAITPVYSRPVMGRKGIGKLSLFSVARRIEVHTVKDGQRSAFQMILDEIQRAIEEGGRGEAGSETYFPPPLPEEVVAIERGTRIILTDLKKGIAQLERALRVRLARRFSIIGPGFDFEVRINGDAIGPGDRDYFHKLQYVWWLGEAPAQYADHCRNVERSELRENVVDTDEGYIVSGWIGTVDEAGKLKDATENLNRITVLARGKLAHEDLLEDFTEGGIYSKYLIGEINADFLDVDDAEDIATSSRQRIVEDDPRYAALKAFVLRELKHIENTWKTWRNEEGTKQALEVPAIKAWFGTLSPDHRRRAESLFGKINRLPIEPAEAKIALFQHAVLAFESLRYRENLDRLEQINVQDIPAFLESVASLDELEAALYYRIVRERVEVVERLNQVVEENAKERVIQELIFDHLWLLDPGWERATESEYMEQQVAKEFGRIDAGLTDEQRAGRVDIKYRKTVGAHVIVELKRAGRSVSTAEVLDQASKYRNALIKLLTQVGRPHDPVEVVVVVGRKLKDWEDERTRQESEDTLAQQKIRVLTYQHMLESAYVQYRDFLERRKDVGKVAELIKAIEHEISGTETG